MSTIQRTLPESIEGRIMALDTAKSKEATLPVGTLIISAATKTRLLAIHTSYTAAVQVMGNKTSISTTATREKNKAQGVARLWTSHYFQGLNNAIDREEYDPEVRAFFLIPVNSGAVPPMDSEEKVKLWGQRVHTGEVAMIAAGDPAMPYPAEADVTIKVNDFISKLSAQSTAVDATDDAEEGVDGLNEEADKVIKKVWDEVETYYNEEPVESMRENAREWGVKYNTLGNPTQVTYKAVRSDNNQPVEAAIFKIISTGVSYTAGPDGTVETETRLIGEEPVKCTHPDYADLTQTINIVEGEAMTVTFVLIPEV